MSIHDENLAGKFIAIEGIDGSGLSTQASSLSERLNQMGHKTYKTKEPSDGPVGGVLRLALTHRIEITQGTFGLLFAADRLDHLHKEVEPKLREGTNVVTDRYCFSNYAYQGTDVDLDWLIGLNRYCRIPDITIFLDVDPTVCKKRMESRMREEYFEKLPSLVKIRNRFLDVINIYKERYSANIKVIDGTNPIEKVTDDIIGEVLKLF